MKIIIQKTIIILICFLLNLNLNTQSAQAQDIFGQSVSTDSFLPIQMGFQNALKYALKNNNNIKAARSQLHVSEDDIGIAKSSLLPHAKFREDFMVTNNPIEAFTIKLNQTRAGPKDLAFGTLDYPGATVNFLTALVLEQSIIDRKSIIAVKMARKEYSANEYIYSRKKEELVNQVAQAYLKIDINQKIVEVINQGLKDTKEHLDIAQNQFKANKGLYSDVLRAKSAVEEREQDLIVANRDLDIAKRNLGLLLGLENSIDTTESVPDIKLNDLDYYKSLAVYRSDVQAMEKRVENAKNNVKHKQADWFPTLNAVASYNFYDPYYPFGGLGNNYIAAAYLKWDIFDGNKRKYEISKARNQEEETKEYLEELKKEVNFRLFELYAHITAHQKNYEYTISAKKSAEENQILTEKYWHDSVLPFVAVIESQESLDRQRLNLINNEYDLKEDLITLLYESGIICQVFGIN